MKQFYACPDGKDYFIQVIDGDKFVSITNIETRRKINYPFKSYTEAADQYKTWTAAAEIRLPKTFYIATGPEVSIYALREELAKHDLTLPAIEKLSKFIVFHGYQSMIIDGDFDNKMIPEMNMHLLKKVSRSKKKVYIPNDPKLNIGIFAN